MPDHYWTLHQTPNLESIASRLPSQLLTASPIDCGLCGHPIAGMGGPRAGAICDHCANLLRANLLRGLVKRD